MAQNGVDTTRLMNKAQHLKWNLDMNISYDPKLAQKGRMLDRLEEIDKTLVNMAISETPASPALGSILGKEINAINVALGTHGSHHSHPSIDHPKTHYSRFDTETTPNVYGMPDANEQRFSGSLPAIVPSNTSSTNGRVAMVGPHPVGSDGRIQYNKSFGPFNMADNCHIAIPITPGSFMSYGSAIPSNQGVGTQGMYTPVNKAAYHGNHRGANSAGGHSTGIHMGSQHTSHRNTYHKNRKVEGFECMTMPNAPQRQYDSMMRPGFQMNDASLAQRASTSAFDPSTVGGPNWKKRAHDLCEQVGSAGLAPPGNFGCIDDDTEVSKDYSWKGNYEMVCNRLGDTWGGWYPEMMGCPPPTNKFQSH